MAVIIARFQPSGESDLWENGVLLGSSPSVSSSGRSPTIRSPAIKLLGNINFASSSNGISVASSEANKNYFLEGMATSSALSDGQILGLNNYLSQKWPGVENVASSPNLYWDKSQNPQRAAATTVNAGHIQGVGAGDGHRFIFHTAMIEEYDSNWRLITNNQSISTGVYSGANGFHCGDGDYAAGKIFAPLELDLAGAGKGIGVYDASSPGLPLIAFKPLSTTSHEFSSVVVVPTAGANGVMFGASFEAGIGADKLWLYDYAGGNVTSSSFGNFLGALQIPSSIVGIQGVAWKGSYFYFSDTNGNRIDRVLYQNGVLSSQAETVWYSPTTVQGLGFDGANLLEVLQGGSTYEITYTLASSRFNSPSSVGLGTWNLNANGTYGGNIGFDTVIPNGLGAAAKFGGGTTNTIGAGAIHVTIDAAYTVGSIAFQPTAATSYSLDGDQISGHALTLNSGSAGGATINVLSGNHSISANLVLADPAGTTLTIAQDSSLSITGPIAETADAKKIVVAGAGRLILGSASTMQTSPQSISPGTVVQIGGSATLELAGSVSELSSSGTISTRANVTNDSLGTAGAAGLVVSGTNQVLGSLDGVGSVAIAAGGDLTVDHIAQNSLTIGGTSGSPGLLTIAASDSGGHPLSTLDFVQMGSSGLAIASSLQVTGFATGLQPTSKLAELIRERQVARLQQLALAQNSSLPSESQAVLVPEPPSCLLGALGSLGVAAGCHCRAVSSGRIRLKKSEKRERRLPKSRPPHYSTAANHSQPAIRDLGFQNRRGAEAFEPLHDRDDFVAADHDAHGAPARVF